MIKKDCETYEWCLICNESTFICFLKKIVKGAFSDHLLEDLCTDKGSRCISTSSSTTHPMTAKCTSHVHFRMHMYTISTYLIISGCAIKPCTDSVHVQSATNVPGTFGGHGMGGGDTTTSLTVLKFLIFMPFHMKMLGPFTFYMPHIT